MAKHHLSHKEEEKGGEHSHEHGHAHHAKMVKHHLAELHKMAKMGHKHHEKAKKMK